MTEKSTESTKPTLDKIAQSEGSTTVLPLLSEAKAPVSVTLTIDRSVKQIAAWAMAVIIAAAIMIGIGIVLAVLMVIEWRESQTEARLVQYYLMDPHYRTPEEMAAWSKFREEHR